MKRLIYQVCLGESRSSKLYSFCMNSVEHYCQRHGIDHIVQRTPKLRISPDPFMSNRSKEASAKHGGFLPIYEKENAFDYLDDYDQIAIVDADIYIRSDAENIFDFMLEDRAFGAVIEREMVIHDWYKAKIINYSRMQYGSLHSNKLDFKPDSLGFEFFNMGLMVLNSKQFKPYLNGQNAKEFLQRVEFQDFVNGKGPWKWSTDQTLLNYFLKKYNVPCQSLHWRWNGLFGANSKIQDCDFIHFFLKDKLPQRGENVEELMKQI